MPPFAGLVARKLVTVTWRATTGHEIPAEDDDRSISAAEAVAWAAGSAPRSVSPRSPGSGQGLEATTGEPPPGDEKKL